jgi:hypothetical protein
MSLRRACLTAATIALAGLTTREAMAQTEPPAKGGFVPPPPGLPGQNPLDLSGIDFLNLELGVGGIGSPEHGLGGSTDLLAGLQGVRIDFLGLSLSALELRASFRPSFDSGRLSGTLASLDEMMFGSRYPNMKVCPGFPTIRCDEDSGYWGLGATVLSFFTDLGAKKSAIRLGELDFVGSVTPAFGKDWKRYRFLPKIGVSIDHFFPAGTDPAAWVGRGMLGFDASFVLGPVFVRPSFRYRPSTGDFVHDYTLEPKIEIFANETWSAWHDRDALRVGGEIGYTHASRPADAFGSDLVAQASNTIYARLVLTPSIFTFGPPP